MKHIFKHAAMGTLSLFSLLLITGSVSAAVWNSAAHDTHRRRSSILYGPYPALSQSNCHSGSGSACHGKPLVLPNGSGIATGETQTTLCNNCHGLGVADAKYYFNLSSSQYTYRGWRNAVGEEEYCTNCHNGTDPGNTRINGTGFNAPNTPSWMLGLGGCGTSVGTSCHDVDSAHYLPTSAPANDTDNRGAPDGTGMPPSGVYNTHMNTVYGPGMTTAQCSNPCHSTVPALNYATCEGCHGNGANISTGQPALGYFQTGTAGAWMTAVTEKVYCTNCHNTANPAVINGFTATEMAGQAGYNTCLDSGCHIYNHVHINSYAIDGTYRGAVGMPASGVYNTHMDSVVGPGMSPSQCSNPCHSTLPALNYATCEGCHGNGSNITDGGTAAVYFANGTTGLWLQDVGSGVYCTNCHNLTNPGVINAATAPLPASMQVYSYCTGGVCHDPATQHLNGPTPNPRGATGSASTMPPAYNTHVSSVNGPQMSSGQCDQPCHAPGQAPALDGTSCAGCHGNGAAAAATYFVDGVGQGQWLADVTTSTGSDKGYCTNCHNDGVLPNKQGNTQANGLGNAAILPAEMANYAYCTGGVCHNAATQHFGGLARGATGSAATMGAAYATHTTPVSGPQLGTAQCDQPCHASSALGSLAPSLDGVSCANCHGDGAAAAPTYFNAAQGTWRATVGDVAYCTNCHDATNSGNTQANGLGNAAPVPAQWMIDAGFCTGGSCHDVTTQHFGASPGNARGATANPGTMGPAYATHTSSISGPQLAGSQCFQPCHTAGSFSVPTDAPCANCHGNGAVNALSYFNSAQGTWLATVGSLTYCTNCHNTTTPGNTQADGLGTPAPFPANMQSYTYCSGGTCHDTSCQHFGLDPNPRCATGTMPSAGGIYETHMNTVYGPGMSAAQCNSPCHSTIPAIDTASCQGCHAGGATDALTYFNKTTGQAGAWMAAVGEKEYCSNCHNAANPSVINGFTATEMAGQAGYNSCLNSGCHIYNYQHINSFALTGTYRGAVAGCTGPAVTATGSMSNILAHSQGTGGWQAALNNGGHYGDTNVPITTTGAWVNVNSDVVDGDWVKACLTCHENTWCGKDPIYWGVNGYATSSGTMGSVNSNWSYTGYEPHGMDMAGIPITTADCSSCGLVGSCDNADTSLQWGGTQIGRGYQTWVLAPYSQEDRMAGINYVLACVDCHVNDHSGGPGSGNIRSLINNVTAASSYVICSPCHRWIGGDMTETGCGTGATMGCGTAGCHLTGNVHRLDKNGNGPVLTKLWNPIEYFADPNGAYDCIDNTSAVVDLYHLDGNGYDASNNQNMVARTKGLITYGPSVNSAFGSSMVFDGASCVQMKLCRCQNMDQFANPADTKTSFVGNLSVDAWINVGNDANTMSIVDHWGRGSGENYILALMTPTGVGRRLVFRISVFDRITTDGIQGDSVNVLRSGYSTNNVTIANGWTYVAATFDKNAAVPIKLYINGVDTTDPTVNSTISWQQPTVGWPVNTRQNPNDGQTWWIQDYNDQFNVTLGAAAHMPTDPMTTLRVFTGSIDDVRLMQVTLTPAQIAARYANATGATPTPASMDINQ